MPGKYICPTRFGPTRKTHLNNPDTLSSPRARPHSWTAQADGLLLRVVLARDTTACTAQRHTSQCHYSSLWCLLDRGCPHFVALVTACILRCVAKLKQAVRGSLASSQQALMQRYEFKVLRLSLHNERHAAAGHCPGRCPGRGSKAAAARQPVTRRTRRLR